MAKYYYSKYNTDTSCGIIQSVDKSEPTTARRLYSGYTINCATKMFDIITTGSKHSYPEDYPNLKYFATGITPFSTISYIKSYGGYPDNKITYVDYTVGDTVYSRGGLVQSNIIAENGTYPSDGRHSDGYWYVRGALANTAPTVPPGITVPELRSGKSVSISWESSTDNDGDIINYYLERSVNGGGYITIRSGGTSRSYDDTPQTSWNTVIYRVRAYDGAVYSGYRTSPSTIVKHFPEFHMKVDGTLKTSDGGWVKINGELREIESITVKVNGVLKEV